MERERVDRERDAGERRRAAPAPVDPRLQLSSVLGNQAYGRLARAMLLRSKWRWDGAHWELIEGDGRRGEPGFDGTDVGDVHNDDKDERGEKRDRAPEDEGGDLLEWLETSAEVTSQYSRGVGPAKVHHRIVKEESTKACFEWALRGLANEGPSPDAFWFWLMSVPDAEAPAWVAEVADGVRNELTEMVRRIARRKLVPDMYQWRARPVAASRHGEAKEVVRRACEILATQCGFTVVDEAAAAGWVVCQYKRSQGASFPEHWWLELKTSGGGTLVLQTVTDVDIEVGGTDLRWHSESSAPGRDSEVEQYEMLRIPVQALLPAQVAVLRRGMEAERGRPRPRSEPSARGRGRGGRGGRGRGARGRGAKIEG